MKIVIIIVLLVLLLAGLGLAAYGVAKKLKDQEYVNNEVKDMQGRARYNNRPFTDEEKARAQELQDQVTYKKPSIIGGSLLAILALVTLIFVPGSIHQIDTGEIAVVKHLGKVKGVRGPGIHWDFFMTNSYTIYDTKVRTITIDTQTYSKDNQIIGVQADLQYTVDAAQVDRIAIEYGSIDKLESKINSIALDNIKSVFSQNTATDVINNRSQISANISETVNNSIDKDYYVNVKTIVMTNIDFTDDFEAAVAAKVAAAQEAEKAENEARKARTEAEAARDVAILEAEANLERSKKEAEAKLYAAEQDAQAKLLIAKAEATSTKLKAVEVARMCGFEIVESTDSEGNTIYDIDFGNPTTAEEIASRDARVKLLTNYLEYIQYLETWDGTLPVTLVGENASTIIIPGN